MNIQLEFTVEIARKHWGLEATVRLAGGMANMAADRRWGTATLTKNGGFGFIALNEWRFFTPEMKDKVTAMLREEAAKS